MARGPSNTLITINHTNMEMVGWGGVGCCSIGGIGDQAGHVWCKIDTNMPQLHVMRTVEYHRTWQEHLTLLILHGSIRICTVEEQNHCSEFVCNEHGIHVSYWQGPRV